MKILNSKEKKRLHAQLAEQYGYSGKLECEFYLNEKKGKIYLLTRAAAEFPYEDFRVETFGLYFGVILPNNDIRLSIEGSQLIGLECSKNILKIDSEQLYEWTHGRDLDVSSELNGWFIVQAENDFIGCGKVVHKNTTTLHNYIPKARYVCSG